MEAKILKKVSPFLFFLLMIAATVPGTAQRNVKNNHQDVRTGVNQVNSQRNTTHTRFANQGNAVRNGNRNFGRTNVNVNITTRGSRNVAYAPVVRPVNVRPNRHINVVGVLPVNAVRFQGHNQNYFFARGIFYTPTNYGYRVVQAPIGSVVNHLPNNAVKVFYNRNVYYQVGNIMLAPILNRRGRIVYELAGYV